MPGKNKGRAPANGKATPAPTWKVPDWKCHLDSYAEKQLLRFASTEDLHAVIDLLWTEPFRTLPHDTPDGRSIVVPAEAVEHLARAGGKFTATRLPEISDFTPEEISKIRRS
jgi:hypothetical protein